MQLNHLTDQVLLADLKDLAARERLLTTKVLHYLREADRRRLYSELRYASLFDFSVKELGYSESAAFRRIKAARMLDQVPELEKHIENGSLNLSQVVTASRFFVDNNVKDPKHKKAILDKVAGLSARETVKAFDKMVGKETRPVPLFVSTDVMTKITRLKELKGQGFSNETTVEFAVDTTIQKTETERFKQISNTSRSTSAKPCVTGISAATKREVYVRDEKKCVKCGSTYNLQFDHRMPKGLGGSHAKENLRLLCFNCNQREGINARLI